MAHAPSIDTGASHASVQSYVIGFVLSVVLTAAAFGIVTQHWLPQLESVVALAALALVQIVVHLVYFLHMNTSSSQRWNLAAFGFTVLVAVIVVGGTLWVLHNVSMQMMSR